ncbi:hypothetical protein [Clostridium perfringens]|uniref:hypothetical protein n=1 Tax=Clostridium perfringens TaxID=1502 RepID=UPI0018E40910|nr:hypothetical protein [Clostridium perfringens]MBI6108747.1 hypothetical protein [Clostridium perfringens]UUR88578.1 hypothetical protein NQ194_16710 [Clostridium perfringens]
MDNTDLKAKEDKRIADIQRLESYYNSGKTTEEKVVANLIKKIVKAQEILMESGFNVDIVVTPEGEITKVDTSAPGDTSLVASDESAKPVEKLIEETSKEKIDATTNESIVENKKTKKVPKILGEETVQKDRFGVAVRIDVLKDMETIVKANKKHGVKLNTSMVVEQALAKKYNSSTGSFDIQFEKKSPLKSTTFNIDKKYIKAIEKLADETGIAKGEILDALIRDTIEGMFE